MKRALGQTEISASSGSLRTASLLGVALVSSILFLTPALAAPQGTAADDAAQKGTETNAVAVPAENEPCIVCHTNEGASIENKDCLVSLHGSLTCVACHDDGEALDDLHAKTKAKRMPMRLKKTTVEDETCTACHMAMLGSAKAEAGDDAEAQAKAVEEAFLALSEESPIVDANGLSVNAHAMVGLETHDGIACISCHEMHDDSQALERAEKTCTSCHHANVFECFTCHDHA